MKIKRLERLQEPSSKLGKGQLHTHESAKQVVAEILSPVLVVVLNKVDMLPAADREKRIATLISKLKKLFEKTKFGADVHFVPVCARGCVADDASDSAFLSEVKECTEKYPVGPES